MRRPLFWVVLFLASLFYLRARVTERDAPPPGTVDSRTLGTVEDLTVTGQVYQKDDQRIYLRDVSVRMQNSFTQSDPIQPDPSQAGVSRQSVSCQDNFICELTHSQEIPLGCFVVVKGDFSPMLKASNPGEFDAAAYYRTMGGGGRIRNGTLLDQSRKYWKVREWLYDFRRSLEERLYTALPENEAGILCALLLGDRQGLSDETQDLYRRAGILHILSISSLHITILGMGFYKALRRLRLPVPAAALAGGLFLLFYGALTGFGVSARRAIGMYLIRMLAQVCGRTYDMLTALGVTGAVMVAGNPFYLEHSGFLLSFSSVLGVAAAGSVSTGKDTAAEKGRQRESLTARLFFPFFRKAGQTVSASLFVTLATLPVQLWFYYEAPVYAVLVNLFVLPGIKPLMLFGFLSLLFPGLFPARKGAELILGWYETVCSLSVKLPFAVWNPGCPKAGQIAAYYLILGTAVLLRKSVWRGSRTGRGGNGKTRAAALGIAALAVCALGVRPPAGNSVAFLDVGQGDCILVRTCSGETYLFDCGSSSRRGVGEYVLLPFLKYYGISKLDGVFASHPDEDHINGIRELLEIGEKNGIRIKQLVLPDVAKRLRTEQLEEKLMGSVPGSAASLPVRYVGAGDGWECGGARFLCLNPRKGWAGEETNQYSQCFYVEFLEKGKNGEKEATFSLLLTGDVEGAGEENLIRELDSLGISHADLLKVAHHGSGGATTQSLLNRVRPGISVISCGENNRYGHPDQELLDRLKAWGSRIVVTKDSGAVWFRISGERVRMGVFLGESPQDYPKYQDAP